MTNSTQYQEGHDYGADGGSRSDNPYEMGSEEYKQWSDGWEMAKDDYREHLDSISPLREEDYEM